MKNILVIGANSTIAHAISRQCAVEKANLFLVGRDPERLLANASDLKMRGATRVETVVADLADHKTHQKYFEKAIAEFGFLDEVYVVHGFLGDQVKAKTQLPLALEIAEVNYLSVLAMSTALVPLAESNKIGSVAIFSSVAGDRGRYSNYVYGSAMAGKSALISGLRAHLSHRGVHVMTVKPGFVDTRMTADFKKGPLWASPEKVAEDVISSLQKQRNICYTPGFWKLIMMIIIHIPERIFKKLKL